MTQIRFGYYLALPVVVVNAVVVGETVRWLDLDRLVNSVRSIEAYQVIAVLLLVSILFLPLIPPVRENNVVATGEQVRPHGEAMIWEESNHWMRENTPQPGAWAGANNTDDLRYFGSYGIPEGNDFAYPEGSYGVMSWWDYGHLITTQGKRIPVANPFQRNAPTASTFLTAESEERAELVLDAHATGANVAEKSNEELRSIVEGNESHEDVRYVMIDHAMVSGKFPAITVWSGPDYSHYRTPPDFHPGETVMAEDIRDRLDNMPYRNTTVYRLYLDDAFGMEHYRLIHETENVRVPIVSYAALQNGQLATLGDGSPAVVLNELVRNRGMLQQIQSSDNYLLLDFNQIAGVKSFERVPGATITGSTDDQELINSEDAVVLADVDMQTNAGRNFTYRQRTKLNDDGSFEITVPYATNNELGVEDGYTNESVLAEGSYRVAITTPTENGFTPHSMAQPEVPETAVVNGETIEVELQSPDEFMEPQVVPNESE
ncbi:MAG: hypothetical protein U5K37_09405 [Natrialbaceae archaeon]|nr:hypothetical protein [Natrialbaceae archaeon]